LTTCIGWSKDLGKVEFSAQCHCGLLTARYSTDKPPVEWPIRACQCSFCRAHGALSTSDPMGCLQFFCSRPELLQRYRFGTGTAEFLLCRQCGVYLGAQMSSDGARFGILNTLTLNPVPAGLRSPEPMNYAGETAESRRARRVVRWTPLVNESI
jgi:hypothetical protein